VWIDVSRLERGERGDRIFQAIADYARNTNRRFIGDTAGLSADATARRAYHMLSNILRYGNLKGFEPAREQLVGNEKDGVAPLEWKGDDASKLKAQIHSFYAKKQIQVPNLEEY
jgi:hypothetical protein